MAPAAPDIINAWPPPAVLDPQLFMAARRGDGERLKEQLLLRNDGDQQGGPAAATATTTAQVTLEIDLLHRWARGSRRCRDDDGDRVPEDAEQVWGDRPAQGGARWQHGLHGRAYVRRSRAGHRSN